MRALRLILRRGIVMIRGLQGVLMTRRVSFVCFVRRAEVLLHNISFSFVVEHHCVHHY